MYPHWASSHPVLNRSVSCIFQNRNSAFLIFLCSVNCIALLSPDTARSLLNKSINAHSNCLPQNQVVNIIDCLIFRGILSKLCSSLILRKWKYYFQIGKWRGLVPHHARDKLQKRNDVTTYIGLIDPTSTHGEFSADNSPVLNIKPVL
jgi:hypothetical protein